MGLTIHWEAKDPKAFIKPEDAIACVEFVKEIAQREGWEILGEWDDVVNPSDYQKQALWVNDRQVPQSSSRRTSTRTIGISVHPHPDCESVAISFDLESGKMVEYVDYGHSKQAYTSQFCKTHYAGFPTHRKVCRLFEAIDKNFVHLEVHDEGDYYGIWDDKKGKENFGEYVAFVHGVGQQLKQEFGGENVEVYSSEDNTDGWKEEYVNHLAKEIKNRKEK